MTDLQVTLPSQDHIDWVQRDSRWKLATDMLYTLCESNPSQSDPTAIVSKFWLIGRAYSAAVERRRTSNEPNPLGANENFYEHRLVPAMQAKDFDAQFDTLLSLDTITEENALEVMKVHFSLTATLKSFTGQWKRSLASKYLHFHFPALCFIYDKRAQEALGQYVPEWSSRRLRDSREYDKYYYKFSLGVIALREEIHAEFGVLLTPMQLDGVLLN